MNTVESLDAIFKTTNYLDEYVTLCSDLKRVKEQVIEETDEPQQRSFLGRLVDDKSEEDGVNSE